jgi:hypothetical protein
MNLTVKALPPLSPRWEMALVSVAGWLALLAIPCALGAIGISWDALNHHIYLGWLSEHYRFDRDLLAASYQSYQFPYSYWPVYRLAYSGFSGAAAGMVLATLHATAVPAVWLIANSCIRGASWSNTVFRAMAVLLAFESVVVLSMFDSTSNDLLSAVPLVWSIALPLHLTVPCESTRSRVGIVIVSGALAGISVALKLSNGPLAILLPLLWVFAGSGARQRLLAVAWGCIAAALAFLAAYAPWGWQLWLHTGNPLYPFGGEYMAPLQRALGWHP